YKSLEYVRRVSELVSPDPDIKSFFARAGGGGGFLYVNLKPRRERKATVVDIVNRLRPKISNLPGVRIGMSIPQAIRIGGRNSQAAYDYTLSGPDVDELYREAPKLEAAMLRLPGLVDVISDLQIKN